MADHQLARLTDHQMARLTDDCSWTTASTRKEAEDKKSDDEDEDDDEEADEHQEDADADKEAEAEEERGGCSLPEHPRLELKGDGPHPLALKGFLLGGCNEAFRVPVWRREQATVVPRNSVKTVKYIGQRKDYNRRFVEPKSLCQPRADGNLSW